jgi:hypothetical protein
MKNSKKLFLVILLFLSYFGLCIIPNAHSYWYFYDLALLHLNNDYYPDVCVLSDDIGYTFYNSYMTSTTYSYLTTLINANGIFQNLSNVLFNENTVRLGQKDPPQNVTKAYLSTGDLNNDGYIDVVVTSINVSGVSIFFQKTDSSGTFDNPLVTDVTGVDGTPQKTAIGDLNADGFNDIAVSGSNGNLIILLNDRSNPGHLFTPISFNHSSVYVDIGDLNADLKNDIVFAGTDDVVVLFQDPLNPGSFVDILNLTAGLRPSCVKIADMDNDGYEDIVAGFSGSEGTLDTGSIAIFYQDPAKPGTFISPITYSLSCEALDIDVGDLNSDGLMDIAVASRCIANSVIKLFFQDKVYNRTFSLAKSLSCEGIPFALKIVDMNQDSRNDIVVSDRNVIVFYQNVSITGDFSERNVILQTELSQGGGNNGGGGGECFISAVQK